MITIFLFPKFVSSPFFLSLAGFRFNLNGDNRQSRTEQKNGVARPGMLCREAVHFSFCDEPFKKLHDNNTVEFFFFHPLAKLHNNVSA